MPIDRKETVPSEEPLPFQSLPYLCLELFALPSSRQLQSIIDAYQQKLAYVLPMRILLILFFLPQLTAQEPAVEEPAVEEPKWPSRLQTAAPSLQALPEKDDAQNWATSHFIIACELEVPAPQLTRFAQTMESIPKLFQQLPIPLWAPPQGNKAVIRLCATETSFVARGGPVEASGCYHPRSGEILIRGDLFLNPPQSKNARLQTERDDDLLIHELTHLAMHQYNGSLPTWLVEGLAEYFSACHTGRGTYDFTQSHLLIRQHIEKFYPRKFHPTLILPSAQTLARTSSRGWQKVNQISKPEDRYRQYACALLLTHYYLEGGKKRQNELKTYLNEALDNARYRQASPLINKHKDLEKKLSNYWKGKGLILDFKARTASS